MVRDDFCSEFFDWVTVLVFYLFAGWSDGRSGKSTYISDC